MRRLCQGLGQFGLQLAVIALDAVGTADEDMIRARDTVFGKQITSQGPKPSLHAIADNRAADFPGNRNADTHGWIAIVPRTDQKNKSGHRNALPGVCRQEITPFRKLPQADSFLRPRARRAANTLRPPTVAERERKP